jgi:hypothetical protein
MDRLDGRLLFEIFTVLAANILLQVLLTCIFGHRVAVAVRWNVLLMVNGFKNWHLVTFL